MAAQNVTGTITVNANFTETVSSGFPSPLITNQNVQMNQALAYATATTGAIDTLYSFSGTLSAAAKHVDLYSGSTDPLGNSIAFARVRFWVVQVTTLTAGYICNIYTRTGTDPVTWLPVTTTGALWCAPGGIVMGVDPFSTSTAGYVVSSTAYDFTVDPASNNVVVNIIIAGNSGA